MKPTLSIQTMNIVTETDTFQLRWTSGLRLRDLFNESVACLSQNAAIHQIACKAQQTSLKL